MSSQQGDLFGAVAPVVKVPAPAPPAGPPVLTLVDASGLIFRAYHALPPLTTSKGQPTNAALGFTRMVLKLMRERRPTHLVLAFDRDSRRGRLAIDPQYKANRVAPPEDLVSQFDLIRRITDVLQVPIAEVPGWEADDVIATLTGRARRAGFEVEIITSDKDFLQLLQDGVRIYDPMKDRPITEADALERFGVTPSQMRDYQALVGDAIDNIPKVPGIGPKTAAELLKHFGTVEALLTRLDEVPKPKVREALKSHVEQLRRALQLVSFRHDLDVPGEPADFAVKGIRQAEARAMFTELEFYRLNQELPSAPATPLRQEAVPVRDAAALDELASQLRTAKRVALFPAYEGEPHSAMMQGLAVVAPLPASPRSAGGGDLPAGAALPLPAERGEGRGEGLIAYVEVATLGSAAVAAALRPALIREGLEVEAHDGKALLHLLSSIGLDGVKLHTDIELLSYLLNPSRKEHALADLARERLRAELPDRGKATLAELNIDQAGALFGAAADAVSRLVDDLWVEANGTGLAALANDLELPLVPVLTRMERAGVCVDRSVLNEVASHVDAQLGGLLAEVYRHAGREFNVGSPPQLAQVLYEDLKLPVLKKNKTGPSTDHEVLEKLAESHPLPNAIIEYRAVAKLKSTYLDTLPQLIGADGRVRTTFHQAAAATGRLSSTNPNLQNIPIRTELGGQLRRAFVAEPGWELVSADYSQVELRILAHISGDEGLLRAFSEDADVHRRTAAEVFGVSIGDVTDDQRRAAKMVNYGIAYGLSPHGLATRLNIPQEEAKGIIDRYFQRFPGINGYVEGTIEGAKKRGYVESLFGRRRYMPDLVSRNRQVVMAAERAAINMPIQGTAADIVKRAMLELDRRIPQARLNGRMLLQVHDELLFECPQGEVEALSALAKEVMAGVAQLKVPLVVDVGHGRSWAEAH